MNDHGDAYATTEKARIDAQLVGKTIESVETARLPEYSWPEYIILRFTDGTHATFSAGGSWEPEGVVLDNWIPPAMSDTIR